jgi:kynurenine formamidase
VKTQHAKQVEWRLRNVTSPDLTQPIPVITATDIPYLAHANRFQNFSIYVPKTAATSRLIGTPANSFPGSDSQLPLVRYLVYVHGGAWRDPLLTSTSIEAAVAHAFSADDKSAPIAAIASINYTVSQFPTHPTLSYDAIKDNHSDPAREAVHPQHVSDVLRGLAVLRDFGLTDQSYVLSGHSAGACISFQATLQTPGYYGLENVADPPCPAAVLGLNGLYELPALVYGLGASHEHLRDEYDMLLSNAFGADKLAWPAASPARFEPAEVSQRVRERRAPRLVVLDQSTEDQLVPMNQKERLEASLAKVSGLRVVEGNRCAGKHAAPWEQGLPIWESLQDVIRLLQDER